ncbi:MAG: hypothetical protein WCI74_05060 [Actinomycetes bacterium]
MSAWCRSGWRQSIGGDASLLAATAIAGTTSYHYSYQQSVTWILIAATVLLAIALLIGSPLARPHSAVVAVAVVVGGFVCVRAQPSANIVALSWFSVAVYTGILASALLLISVFLRGHWQVALALVAALVAVVSMVLIIVTSVVPLIDVWVIFQQSTAGLLHGINPYTQYFPGVPKGQTADCFNYLPATFLLPAPGNWLLSDVRYGELAVMLAGFISLLYVVAKALTVKLWRGFHDRKPPQLHSQRGSGGPEDVDTGGDAGRRVGGWALVLVVVAMTLPGTLRVVQQSWNESIVLGCVLVAVALVLKGHINWAIVPLALAVATKQHMLLVLPLWAIWPVFGWRRTLVTAAGALAVAVPWLIMDFGRFYTCTVTFFLETPSRSDSLSFYRFLPSGMQSWFAVALVVVAYVLVLWRCDRSVGALVLSMAAVMIGFDLYNKQSFENQWWLAAVLIVVALAVSVFERDQGEAKDVLNRAEAQV